MVRKTSTAQVPQPEAVPRTEAIARLRSELSKLTDIENSICKVAGEKGIFCQGFERYSDAELRNRYGWIVARRPEMTREELETIANDWQLAQQEVYEMPIACDVQCRVHDTCRGWNDFTNEQLARFYFQLTGNEIKIT